MNNHEIQPQQRSHLSFALDLVISLFYVVSLICVGVGIVVLLIIVLFGGIVIENAQWLALGILLIFPLRYLKKWLEK